MKPAKSPWLLILLVLLVISIGGCAQEGKEKTQQGEVDITGAWHGTYTSSKGNGEWSWVIKKSGGGYIGVLTTTKPYNGENVPVSVKFEGNKITVGWVAVGVVFEGTVSGDRMSGTWRFQNGMDSGTWEGVRGESSITPSLALPPTSPTPPASPTPPTLPPQIPSMGIKLPKEDVKGEDLADVPRYKPSVRTDYSKDVYGNALFISITYYTRDSMEKVRQFYINEMPKYNWHLLKEESNPGVTFYNFEVGESRLLDFRQAGCTDPETCLPYAKITFGSFKIGNDEYTVIQIDYETYAGGKEAQTPEAPTETPQSISPSSSFGESLDDWIKSVLANSLGQEVVLTGYNEFSGYQAGLRYISLAYTSPSKITDLSTTAQKIKNELEKRGVGSDVISVSVSQSEAIVIVGSFKIEGKEGTLGLSALTISLYKDSAEILVSSNVERL